MIEEKEGNRKCDKCGRYSIAAWHGRACYCDDCLGKDVFYRPVDRDSIGNDRADEWIGDNWKDDCERAFEDARC